MCLENVPVEALKWAHRELPKLYRERTINLGLIRCGRIGFDVQDYYPPPPKEEVKK